MMARGFAAAGAIVLSVACSTASLASAGIFRAAADNCQNKSLAPDGRIAACTELLHSNFFAHKVEAIFLANRAEAYRDKGDAADEIADVKQALAYLPDDKDAIALRDQIDRQTPGTIPVTP